MLKNLHLQNPSKYISWETLVLQKQKALKIGRKKPTFGVRHFDEDRKLKLKHPYYFRMLLKERGIFIVIAFLVLFTGVQWLFQWK